MLRALASPETPAAGGPKIGAASAARRDRPRLLVVHHGDPRIAALGRAICDLGYGVTVVATGEDALCVLQRSPAPDVLLTTGTRGSARRGAGFARECLARWPALRALYVAFVPGLASESPDGRERVLAAPFNADQLAQALAGMWPAEAS